MSKVNDLMNEIKKYDEEIQNLQKQKQQKTVEVAEIRHEKKQYILNHFGDKRDPQQIKLYELKIENTEKEINSIDEQILMLENEKKNKFAPKMDEIKKERQKVVEKNNKRIEELKHELFRTKLETMVQLEQAMKERNELQQEVNEFDFIGQYVSDRRPELKNFTVYAPDYLIGYAFEEPVAIQQSELLKLTNRDGNGRLPKSLELYKRTGEVVQSEKEAIERLKELKKKGEK
ncbi:hypothetical protein [Bacillus paralicheniformis]|uniref:hypothetical protein n=1 Tax=Bacillus paralicheniformis TaxID=1648923 RepID=UPI0018A1035D|nr:hypothetical protein [Bacillus paralicheniformis]